MDLPRRWRADRPPRGSSEDASRRRRGCELDIPRGEPRRRRGVPRGPPPRGGRAAAAGCHADISWGRVSASPAAAPPRLRRYFVRESTSPAGDTSQLTTGLLVRLLLPAGPPQRETTNDERPLSGFCSVERVRLHRVHDARRPRGIVEHSQGRRGGHAGGRRRYGGQAGAAGTAAPGERQSTRQVHSGPLRLPDRPPAIPTAPRRRGARGPVRGRALLPPRARTFAARCIRRRIAATSRLRRGCHVDIPWRQVSATPRPRL